MSDTEGKRVFLYRLSPETFGYILVEGNQAMVWCDFHLMKHGRENVVTPDPWRTLKTIQ
jgi:hypothetical protein